MLAEPDCYRRSCAKNPRVESKGDETTEKVVCNVFPDGVPAAHAEDVRTCDAYEKGRT